MSSIVTALYPYDVMYTVDLHAQSRLHNKMYFSLGNGRMTCSFARLRVALGPHKVMSSSFAALARALAILM